MIYGLGSTEDEAKIIEFLDASISATSGIRSQHTRYVYRAVGSTAIGRMAQFDWMVSNFDAFKSYHGANLASQANEIIGPFGEGGKTQSDIDKLQTFWDANTSDLSGSASSLNQAIENVRANMDWVENNYQTVLDWVNTVIGSPLPSDTTTQTSGSGRVEEACITALVFAGIFICMG